MDINQIAFIVLLGFSFIVFLYLLGCEKDQSPQSLLKCALLQNNLNESGTVKLGVYTLMTWVKTYVLLTK